MSYIAQAKQQQAGRQNAQAESALDDMLDDSLQTEPSTAVPPKKRSRDEILRSLRAGNSNLEQASTQESSKPSKFRKVGAPAEAPVVPTDKKVKKKKKASSKSSSAAIDHPAPVPRPSFLPKPTDPAPAPIPAPQINDTEDLDIFAGEAEYSGLSDSDSDEPSRSDKGKQRQKEEYIEQQRPVKKGTWFNDDLDDQADAIQAPVMPQPAPAPTPDSDEEEDENAQRRAEIRAMLDADKAAEKAEKRREAKQRWKEKQGLGGREFGEEVNRPKEGKKLNDASVFFILLN